MLNLAKLAATRLGALSKDPAVRSEAINVAQSLKKLSLQKLMQAIRASGQR
ncbi:hypothetical protein [Deinococcus sp.]|uniref:hypothetical protein n=1 Tax=Deinococcus sp. TaxID=47478 RepID=UPI0025DD1CC3|nr:hypothetical protein [Deinococcus sp.]